MQSASSRIWTRIAVFISYGDNDYTTGTSGFVVDIGSPVMTSAGKNKNNKRMRFLCIYILYMNLSIMFPYKQDWFL